MKRAVQKSKTKPSHRRTSVRTPQKLPKTAPLKANSKIVQETPAPIKPITIALDMIAKYRHEPSVEGELNESKLADLIVNFEGTLNDVLMLPGMAQHILKTYNTGNRALRITAAKEVERTLRRNGWENTGEPIIFAKEGILNNGQHRLEGIVRAGIPVQVDIRFGVPRRAFANTDTGAKRSAGDVLAIAFEGIVHSNATAAAIRLLMAYDAGGLPGSYHSNIATANDEVLENYKKRPLIQESVSLTVRKLGGRKGFLNASAHAFTYLALTKSNSATVESFLDLVESGLTAHRQDAPRLLREYLLSEANITHGSRNKVIERLALFIKAWNYWRSGERPSKLIYKLDEDFPVIGKIGKLI